MKGRILICMKYFCILSYCMILGGKYVYYTFHYLIEMRIPFFFEFDLTFFYALLNHIFKYNFLMWKSTSLEYIFFYFGENLIYLLLNNNVKDVLYTILNLCKWRVLLLEMKFIYQRCTYPDQFIGWMSFILIFFFNEGIFWIEFIELYKQFYFPFNIWMYFFFLVCIEIRRWYTTVDKTFENLRQFCCLCISYIYANTNIQ